MEDIEKLNTAIDTMARLLSFPSGATDFQLRQAAYYAAATWHLHQFDKFPYLALYGETGTGKSCLLEALSPFCFNPIIINISTGTPATLREKFDKASPGTVLIEESAETTVSAQAEAHLTGRFARITGKASKMIPTPVGGWEEEEYITYGATIVHRRDRFEDEALNNRSIWLNLQINPSRTKKSYYSIPTDLTEDVVKQLKETAAIELPEADIPDEILGRIADVYDPIVRLAQLVGDKPFLAELKNEMHIATAAFRDGQTYAPKALAFKALIGCLQQGDRLNLDRSVSVELLCKHLQTNYLQGMKPRTMAKYLRDLGFELGISGGVTKVVGMTIPQLAKASRQIGVPDELLAKMAKDSAMDATSKVIKEDMELEGGKKWETLS